ncbi:MAG: ABC transporter substrate-binding protein [Pseudomonadota bacterium]|nr:ABC transporter substrate-binding protein [Pseudomonadota bacterium]
MSRLATSIVTGLFLAACGAPPAPQDNAAESPMRIVSLDYCADQYVLKLADPEQVLAISPDATKHFSYMREAAIGVPTVRPVAEDVLILKPDLVVRAYGGGPNAAAFFERAGVPVLTVGWTSNVDSEEVGSIPSLIQHMADGLGQSARGQALIADFRERLAAINKRSNGETALYLTPAGVTSGPGAMVHEMLVAAGFENFQQQPGWRSIPLERLAYETPDVIAAAFFDQLTNHPDSWSPMKHPVATRQMDEQPVVQLKGAWTACGGWFILDAIEALAEGGGS